MRTILGTRHRQLSVLLLFALFAALSALAATALTRAISHDFGSGGEVPSSGSTTVASGTSPASTNYRLEVYNSNQGACAQVHMSPASEGAGAGGGCGLAAGLTISTSEDLPRLEAVAFGRVSDGTGSVAVCVQLLNEYCAAQVDTPTQWYAVPVPLAVPATEAPGACNHLIRTCVGLPREGEELPTPATSAALPAGSSRLGTFDPSSSTEEPLDMSRVWNLRTEALKLDGDSRYYPDIVVKAYDQAGTLISEVRLEGKPPSNGAADEKLLETGAAHIGE